ncbi:hypothetical protein CAPTEDRAFT_172669 [Capitella teleta]|uniref:Lipoxygenase domain-containing protein n=1 Tax=Capitella teleta TaxID=283909 RepID=R7T7C1_CAPTE|nr:hypothetical protein CAPTEDRAFT_172669 [Capitella teleta]|eukprot:ELT89495.1 hypothetical protein CAPTEDRAFT_172669 [Capitella teleta]
MGNCCVVKGAVDHWVYVKTGDRKGAANDADLRIILSDNEGHSSSEFPVKCYFSSDFQRGKTDVFQAPSLQGFGDITNIEFWREKHDEEADWYCEVLVVNDRRSDKCFYFPVQRWVNPNQRYKIQEFSTILPQFDPNREERQKELEEKRLLYTFGQTAPDLPVQLDIISAKLQQLNSCGLPPMPAQQWDGLEELGSIYNATFPEPAGMDRWSNDLCFGAQRLIGCNPVMIKLATELPEKFVFSTDMLRPFLEGWSLKQIIEAKRLFVADYKILEDLPTKDDRPLCAPIGLFFVTGDKNLVPIAIQLYQDIAPDNPVFLPNDNPFTWLLAKMWLNNGDAAVHQALSHFCFTHLLMEGVSVALNRHVSPTHPIYKLLSPHLLFLLAVNARGLDQLSTPGGWIDQTTTIGREGMFELMRRGIEEWRFDVQGCFPKELESRGVLDPRTLPNYAYRDDGLLLHKAIENYVTRIARHYYGMSPDSPTKIAEDYELQNWVKELSIPKENGGVGLKGIPGNGRFKRIEDVIFTLTNIIFICSVQHSATNFSQYDEYAFPPNYPALLEGEPPIDKLDRTEEDLVSILPDKAATLETIAVCKVLSARGTKSLGEWEFQQHYDPMALKAEKDFRIELQHISRMIKQRNEQRDAIYKYPYLDPEIIPNNIGI